jgi:hypothetical protein
MFLCESLIVNGPCRKFSLMDGLLVIVALALVFAGWRGETRFRPAFEGVTTIQQWASEAHAHVRFPLMLLTYLILGLRLRRPRPTLRRLTCQPGAVAAFAMVFLGLGCFVNNRITENTVGFYQPMQGRVTFEHWIYFFFKSGLSAASGYVVAIVWSLLVIGGRWRPEPGWIDRSGRVLGWCWIVWGLTGAFLR